MARLDRLPEGMRRHLLDLELPELGTPVCVEGPPLQERRIAILSTAGLHRRGDPAFELGAADYRVIPADVGPDDLLMSHVSVNYDRSGWQQDRNVVFPLDRLRELAAAGRIGSVADYHYAVMGATDPGQMEASAHALAELLRGDGVTGVLLVPV